MSIHRGTQFGLLGFIDPRILMRLARHLPSISPRRWPRLLGVLGAGVGMLPLTVTQRVLHQRTIASTSIDQPPIFIIGHWRSGTTHLHNILCHDPQFGSVRMFDCVAPACSLISAGWLPTMLEAVMPAKRPMDNMKWPMSAPQEEEIALAKLTPYSWYLQFLFPRNAVATFERYVLLKGAHKSAQGEVSRHLLNVLKLATLKEGGKRLLLKNPVHTARIPQLLEMFPDARFIYLHRSPLDVYQSTRNLHRKILELTSLQPWDEELIEKNVLGIYPRLMDRYRQDREQLRSNQLIEVGYDELDKQPMDVVKNIYESLELTGFSDARLVIQSYLNSIAGYRKNRFAALSGSEERQVRVRWQQGFSMGGYENSIVPSCSAAASMQPVERHLSAVRSANHTPAA